MPAVTRSAKSPPRRQSVSAPQSRIGTPSADRPPTQDGVDAPGDAHLDAQSTAPVHPIAALLMVPISAFLLMIPFVLTAHVISVSSAGL